MNRENLYLFTKKNKRKTKINHQIAFLHLNTVMWSQIQLVPFNFNYELRNFVVNCNWFKQYAHIINILNWLYVVVQKEYEQAPYGWVYCYEYVYVLRINVHCAMCNVQCTIFLITFDEKKSWTRETVHRACAVVCLLR